MKTYKYRIGDQELTLRLSGERVAEALLAGAAPAVAPDEMPQYAAAVSLALLEHETAVLHDDEADVITLEPHASEWANPALLTTKLPTQQAL